MDKKAFEIVLDEIRKCVLTEQRIKAIDHVHGYFSSEQVTELLKYFSWAEPQIRAIKALQRKMVAIPTTKVVNILNCFTFSKDKLLALEHIALNISDAHNYRPIEDLFRIHLHEKKRCRKILEQAAKVGCQAPDAMISSCGITPGNPYPQGKPSVITGIFPGTPARRDGDDSSIEGRGIAARILGPFKPAPSTYNPHKPVPYPIPPCRPHATIAPSAYNNAGLVTGGGVIASTVQPPPYGANQSGAAFSRPSSQQNHNSTVQGATVSSHPSNLSTSATPGPSPSPSKTTGLPASTVPISPVFPGYVPTAAQSPSSATLVSSVIKGPLLPGSPLATANPAGRSTPVTHNLTGVSPSVPPSPSVIKSYTPNVTPCPTPVPNGSFTPVSSAHSGMSRSGTPSGMPAPKSSSTPVPAVFSPQSHLPPSTQGLARESPVNSPNHHGMSNPNFKVFSPEIQSHHGSSIQASFTGHATSANSATGSSTPTPSVIRSFTPSIPTHQDSSPNQSVFSGLPVANSVKHSSANGQSITNNSASPYLGTMASEQYVNASPNLSNLSRHSNSPVASAFKGPSRSSTPSLSSLVIPNSSALSLNRSLNLSHSAATVQATLSNTGGLQGLPTLPTLNSQGTVTTVSHTAAGAAFSALPGFSNLTSASGYLGASNLPTGNNPNAANSSSSPSSVTSSPFGLGMSTPISSIFPGLPSGPLGSANTGFSGFAGSNTPAGSPVLSSFVGLQGPSSSVAAVAPLQAAVAAAAAAPSSAPVLPGFASAFSSSFNPALVAQAGLSGGLQPTGNAAFPGLLSFPGIPGFSQSPSPASLSGLQHTAVQSALLQASALENYPGQPNSFPNYASSPGTPFGLQPGLHPQRGWQ
ncbi:proline and serine-rich protein 1 isoform X2 [Erpetoichthys calabaricus]|uniref:Proline and serine rich 1 n=1 Tax=Erpetoichthys calabaricus TaxID=27687 RepID=A0A8C4X710_ERPCA|nr:proline and serine-rich protein 1 isoform X2 [Erpetoichthys calabaricus]